MIFIMLTELGCQLNFFMHLSIKKPLPPKEIDKKRLDMTFEENG